MAFLWITEALPLAVTALIPIVLHPMMGIASANETAKSYFNDIQVCLKQKKIAFCFFGLFIIETIIFFVSFYFLVVF